MCGIWLLLSKNKLSKNLTNNLYNDFMKIKDRGPDNSYYKLHDQQNLVIGFHRLAINGLTSIKADQPFILESDESIFYAICNGEIYNYKELAVKYDIQLSSGSDCEILLPLYLKIGLDAMMKELDAECALIICEIDKATNEVKLHVSRDHVGIRPLFISWSKDTIVLSSEMKGIPFLDDDDFEIQQFPPRHHLTVSSLGDFGNLDFIPYIDFSKIETTIFDFEEAKRRIREELIFAIESRMMAQTELCCLLSGGLDSSLVAAVASNLYRRQGKKLKTFCIAIDENAPDAVFAKKAAAHIGSEHTTIIISEEEWLSSVEHVIYCIESFDTTSVRASCGQFLISKWIKENTDIKVIILGDGADEVENGYIYTLKAPSKDAFHNECLKLINNIHFFDVKRADEGVASNSREARVPFLRRKYIEMYLSISVDLRMPSGKYEGTEKYLVREAFRGTGLLPDEILFRRKEAFSDGLSTIQRSWFTILKEKIETLISDEEFEREKTKYRHCPPSTKEALFYRQIFEKYFGKRESVAKVIPYYWMPNCEWCNATDPSARVLEHYNT